MPSIAGWIGQPIILPPDVQRTTLASTLWAGSCASTGRRRCERHPAVRRSGYWRWHVRWLRPEKIFRLGEPNGLRVLLLDAGPFLVPTHVQNLPDIGLNVPGPIAPASDPAPLGSSCRGWPGEGMFRSWARRTAWAESRSRGRVVSPAAGKRSGGVAAVSRNVPQTNYPILEQQTGVSVVTNFIQGSLFNLLKQRVTNAIGTVRSLDTAQDPPLAVEGESPASGSFSFDKYTSTNLTIEAARDAASVPGAQRRFFAVPNAHVTRIQTAAGAASSIDVVETERCSRYRCHSTCAVILALGTIESTRLALVSFPTSPGNPAGELMGRNRRRTGAPISSSEINRGDSTRGTSCRRQSRRVRYSCAGQRPRESFISKSLRRRILKVILTISCFR